MRATRWLISVPVWGARCVNIFCAVGLPTLQRAVEALTSAHDVDVRLIVHTDQMDKIRGATGLQLEGRAVPAGARDFDSMSQAHREVLALGMLGDVVIPTTADIVFSEQGLRYCADVFDGNKRLRLIMCAVPRMLQQGRVPDTADAQALMAWAWENRHPIVRDSTWPDGRGADLSRMFFSREDAVVTRQCLPAPLAVRVDGRRVSFTPTTDVNLMQHFDRTEIHIATDCRQLALIEMSPAEKDAARVDNSIEQRLADYALKLPDPLQRWCLGHKIMLVGEKRDCGDDDVVEKIMRVSGGRP